MANPFLNLLQNFIEPEQVQPDFMEEYARSVDLYPQSLGGGQPQQPTTTQVMPMNSTNYKQQIMEKLGAVEPNKGGTVMDILSQRFQPTLDDSTDALFKTMMGQATTSQDIANDRGTGAMKQLAGLADIQKLAGGGGGGATGELVNRMMQEDPSLSFSQALQRVQVGYRQGYQMDSDGNAVMLPGYDNVKRNIKYNESAGNEQGKLDYARQIGREEKIGTLEGEVEGQNIKNTKNSERNLPVIKEARELLPQASGGGIQAAGARAKQFFGVSDDSTKANARLKILGAKLVGAVPRFEGPQGVLDVELYKQAAGDVANTTIPTPDRLAALETIVDLFEANGLDVSSLGQPTGQSPAANGGGNQPIQITNDLEYDQLESGTPYIAPDGTPRTKR